MSADSFKDIRYDDVDSLVSKIFLSAFQIPYIVNTIINPTLPLQ